jgi:hypothetical protein
MFNQRLSLAVGSKRMLDDKMKSGFDSTYKSQVELLPRITICYGCEEPVFIAFEWLWWSLWLRF